MDVASKVKKLKSPPQDLSVVNTKTSITCSNVPDGLFEPATAKKHFGKFGRVQKIRLFPKRQMCIIEYDQPPSMERALLNAGAFDGFMFDVTRAKPRVRRKSSKKEDDPDWVPDSEVEEELSAMSGALGGTYRITRQKPMELQSEETSRTPKRVIKQAPVKKRIPVPVRTNPVRTQPTTGIESPVKVITTQTTMSTAEAAVELHQLRYKTSLTPDEQWRILDARDRILRAWGGAGARVKVGGATIGTCPDMCPEKERLHRQAEHQVMTLECVVGSDGELEPWRAVKQYSRSSADQEIPMCYELRSPAVLARSTAYLLHHIADTPRPVSLPDWFHFMWDRLRGIRKDITQQALCCAESIRLVEMCARFHAHCAARLADLDHTQFDQKLNTDNLTKCLQTLKHMYADVSADQRPREAEFRGYIALLNLGDANFWWEIKQLPVEIQKSEPIVLAIEIFYSLDNNNYVRFFRLVRERASYLQACVLLRYFNDVRARGLARMVKAYSPRGGALVPAQHIMNALAFESIQSLKLFVSHYGLRCSKHNDEEVSIILSRNEFIEDSDPYPVGRAINLIESKRNTSVGEVIAGGPLPDYAESHNLYTSFHSNGSLREAALIAEDLGYNTINDSNKDIHSLKAEIQRLAQGGKNLPKISTIADIKIIKPETKTVTKPSKLFTSSNNEIADNKIFSFKPAIPVASPEVISNSPEIILAQEEKKTFSFSKPQNTIVSNLFTQKVAENVFKNSKNIFTSTDKKGIYETSAQDNKPSATTVFGSTSNNAPLTKNNLFAPSNNNIFTKNAHNEDTPSTKSIFSKPNEDNIMFAKTDTLTKFGKSGNVFAKPQDGDKTTPTNIFGNFTKPSGANAGSLFSKPNTEESSAKNVFMPNGDMKATSPGTLFKSAFNQTNGSDIKTYSIFQSKNKGPSVSENIFNSANTSAPENDKYEFSDNDQHQLQMKLNEEKQKEAELLKMEEIRKEAERERELKRLEEERKKEEELQRIAQLRKQEEQRRADEKRKEEERKQEELRLKLEEERKRKEEEIQREKLKKIAEENEKKFKEKVETESNELVKELMEEVRNEIIADIMKEELENLRYLVNFAGEVSDELITEFCNEICNSEMQAEKFLTHKLMHKWFNIWREQFKRNVYRRQLLEETPVWLPDRAPVETALILRSQVENEALKQMRAVNRGYRFKGELNRLPPIEPYNIMDIIRSPLLKRMKQLSYPYDKCFFWKVTLVSPGAFKWMCKKINIQEWVMDVFSDNKQHDPSLIHVSKQSWNNLMEFAISVSLAKTDCLQNSGEALEGSNGVMFFVTEKDNNIVEKIDDLFKWKYPLQIIPVAIVMSKSVEASIYGKLDHHLTELVNAKIVSAYKIFIVDFLNTFDSLHLSTKRALKWLSKNNPPNPPLEFDLLKSMCQRYLGDEIWYRLRSEKDTRIGTIKRDLKKLIQFYNMTVDKLTAVITNEDIFNYPSFALEFKKYLNHSAPFPKPYEFITSDIKTCENISAIKDVMAQMKLPDPRLLLQSLSVMSIQDEIRQYCNQIGWVKDSEEVVGNAVVVYPNELADTHIPCKQFNQYFEECDFVNVLNIIVYEKINRLQNFGNRHAVYERAVLENYRNYLWLYDTDTISNLKHRQLEDEDEIDFYIEAKRRKFSDNSNRLMLEGKHNSLVGDNTSQYLMLEDKDYSLVEDNIKATNETICKYNNCQEAVKQLEDRIEEEKRKSEYLDNLLKSALSNV